VVRDRHHRRDPPLTSDHTQVGNFTEHNWGISVSAINAVTTSPFRIKKWGKDRYYCSWEWDRVA